MSPTCLVCDKTGATTTRNSSNIFKEQTSLGKPIAGVLSAILEKPISEDAVHTNVLCKSCQKVVLEYDTIKVRLEAIKSSLLSEFKNTLPKYDFDYETFPQKTSKTPVKLPGNPDKSRAKVVLSASKLQPLPPDYVINMDMNKLAGQFNFNPKVVLPRITCIQSDPLQTTPPTTNTLNLKVTVGSTVLTHTVSTSPPTVQTYTQSVSTEGSPTKSTEITEVYINELLNKRNHSLMSFNVDSLPKDFMSSSVMRGDDEVKVEGDVNNDEQPMEIDEDCTLVKVTKKGSILGREEKSAREKDKDASTKNSKCRYVLDVNDVTLEPMMSGGNDDDDNENDEDYQEHTIVMSGDDASILRVMSGQKLLYEGGEISLVMPGDDDDDGNDDNDDDNDSNDESQIELQMSGDEETANAILAAARDQGGAFIKVESGEMYRLKSVVSKSKPDKAEATKKKDPVVVWKDGKFRCRLCDPTDEDPLLANGCGDATLITDHMQTAHGITIHTCADCHVAFTEYKQYCKHLDQHEENFVVMNMKDSKSKVHECSICNKRYTSRSQFRDHLNTHEGCKPHVCTVCGKSFASKYTHQAHLKIHMDRPRPHKCSQCDKSFFTQQNLLQHERTHLGVKSFHCNVCGKSFGTAHNLEMHGVVHSGKRPFECTEEGCGKAFARRAELRDHARTHTGERPFACGVCGARFAQRSNLHSHTRATHYNDKRHQCRECPKKFKRRRLLEYHIKASHTGERPLECEVCHATFVYPEHYKKHLRIHSGERPFVCEVCGKGFNSRDNRNTHRFVHSDKKPYECLVCGAGYMRKQLLYAHMNSACHLAESIVVNQPRVQKIISHEDESSDMVSDAINIKSTDKLDTLFENAEELQLETSDGKAVTGFEITTDSDGKMYLTGAGDKKLLLQDARDSLDGTQDVDQTTLLELHNPDSVKTENSMLQGISLDQFVDQTQVAGSDLVRLVQVTLPGGGSGWLAVNQ